MRNQRTHKLGEQSPSKREVVGSSPTRSVTFAVICKANCGYVDFSPLYKIITLDQIFHRCGCPYLTAINCLS